MKQYKFSLDKSSKKYKCPSCGKKRFVRYKNNETHELISAEFGRCDREQVCSYHKSPTNTITNIDIKIITHEPSYICSEMVNKTQVRYDLNPFVQHLYSKYKNTIVDLAIKKYRVGTANYYNGSTVFWQIDENNNVRTGKVMLYDSETGKRTKNQTGSGYINWVHTIMKIDKFNLNQCLFGLHLLKPETKAVAIVESEKTAVIMSIVMPGYLWMATGSSTGFKREILKPLKHKKVIAFPDNGCYERWYNISCGLNNEGYNIRVSDFLENEDFEDGIDLADLDYSK